MILVIRRTELPRGGAPAAALREIEAGIDDAWSRFCADYGVDRGGPDETVLAENVVADPSEFEWRIVDAAMDHLRCPGCGAHLGGGPLECADCRIADGFRYGAREIDRPEAQPGNEHGLRVATSAARNRHRYPAAARCGYELSLPDLLAGRLFTTAQAQAARALLDRLGADELERVTTFDEVQALARR